jgi:hypothetical protein
VIYLHAVDLKVDMPPIRRVERPPLAIFEELGILRQFYNILERLVGPEPATGFSSGTVPEYPGTWAKRV